MRPNKPNKFIHILNSSYDVVTLLRSYLSPVDLLCFQLATNLPQFHFGTRSASGSLDMTAVLKGAGISRPKTFLECLQATNSALVTDDLFPAFGLPKTEGWWEIVVTLAGEDLGLKMGVLWSELPLHLAREVFPSYADGDTTSFVSTPSRNLHGLLREWVKLSNGKGGLPLIYNGRLQILWTGDATEETPSDAVDPNTEVAVLTLATDGSVDSIDKLHTVFHNPVPLFHDAGFCINQCQTPRARLMHCTVPRDVERLRLYYTEVEVHATDEG